MAEPAQAPTNMALILSKFSKVWKGCFATPRHVYLVTPMMARVAPYGV